MESLIDTHCHIHDSDYDFLIDDVLKQAKRDNVIKMICVGTNLRSSKEALDFSLNHENCYFSLGLHPHLAVKSLLELEEDYHKLKEIAYSFKGFKLVAIGECGLDYFYHKDLAIRNRQKQLFSWQLDLARELNISMIFHVRNAFKDFWSIYDKYKLSGVVHSFSDSLKQVEIGLNYNQLYFGLNGITTFSKNSIQIDAFKAIPLTKLVLETDAPYLTPAPFRGKVNKPQYVRAICDFLADLRNEDKALLAKTTTNNALSLFNL